jgi:hypothetical protein
LGGARAWYRPAHNSTGRSSKVHRHVPGSRISEPARGDESTLVDDIDARPHRVTCKRYPVRDAQSIAGDLGDALPAGLQRHEIGPLVLYTLGLDKGRRIVRTDEFDRLGQLAKIKEGRVCTAEESDKIARGYEETCSC